MSAHRFDEPGEPFLAAVICPRFEEWLRRYPEAAYDLAKLVPDNHTAVTLRRADLAGVINGAKARPIGPPSPERRDV